MRTRGGAVCNRHRRWHIDGADTDLTGFPEYLRAERCLSGALWKRGVGLTTGELQLAATLVRHWAIDADLPPRLHERMAAFGIDRVGEDSVFLIAYPEIVRLATVLTDLSFASYLLPPRFRLAQQVWALEAAVITIMHSSTTDPLHQVAERIVTQGEGSGGDGERDAAEQDEQTAGDIGEGARCLITTPPQLPAAPPQHRPHPGTAFRAWRRRSCQPGPRPSPAHTRCAPPRMTRAASGWLCVAC